MTKRPLQIRVMPLESVLNWMTNLKCLTVLSGQKVFWLESGASKTSTKMATFSMSLGTYNLHGWNQGSPYLRELLLEYDVICVQEHWLGSHDGHKLINLNDDFTVIVSFAVDYILGNGVLKGRPFGGVAIFIRNAIINELKIVYKNDRVIVVQLNNILICNVYMPCSDNELFISVLGSLSDVVISNNEQCDHCILSGDFNCRFLVSDPLYNVLDVFIKACN